MTTGRRGRPQASSREQVEAAAIELFLDRGYTRTGIATIAETCGISKTTFFRYYPSKSAIVWSAFDDHIGHLERALAEASAEVPTMIAVRSGIVAALRASIDQGGIWMKRFRILDNTPELRAEESEHWLTWANVVARFVAGRLGDRPGRLVPASVGGAVQAAFLAVLREWLDLPEPGVALLPHLDAALTPLCAVLQNWLDDTAGPEDLPAV